jgi:hypothetical protein
MADVYLGVKTMDEQVEEMLRRDKEKAHEYYLMNKEHICKMQKEWCSKNKEKIKKDAHDNYLKNKEQHNTQERSYYEKNKEKVKARVRKYYSENKEEIKNKQNEKRRKDHPPKEKIIQSEKEVRRNQILKRNFGITLSDYNQMRFEQDNCCFICGRHEDEFPLHQLFVDHDHITGKIRKLLCNNCNSILGHARDDVNVLYKAVAYLKLFG